jgi:FAD/FMN-containing dehydrogenase
VTAGTLTSWGRYPRHPQQAYPIYWQEDVPGALTNCAEESATLAYGCGRSYGDSCLAVSDRVLSMCDMNRIVAADWARGIIVAEAGLTLAELIRLALPRGWFPPVVPGTKFVTLGGAVANDVHGKNHHVMGTFGRHVRSLTLYRSDAGVITATSHEQAELFAATIGGLGLTGVILTVELQLRPVRSARIEERRVRFRGLDEFFELARGHDQSFEYTAAWIDCLASGRRFARGYCMAGNHATDGELRAETSGYLSMPIDPPFSLINPLTLSAFNALVYHSQSRNPHTRTVDYGRFLFPLDSVDGWNRMYGRAGFQQYQCVVPQADERAIIGEMLREIVGSGTGSFLAVLKQFGVSESPGLLSFPMPGLSLALDFPQREAGNSALFERLDTLVQDAGGRLYPAKDAHMSAAFFKRAYPAWQQIESLRDPRLMSRFWRRVIE